MSKQLKSHLRQKRPFSGRNQVAVLNLLVAGSCIREKIESACAEYSIKQGHYNTLRILAGAPEEGYARAEIISRLIDKGSDVTRLIDRLVKIGFVSRVKSDTDRRIALHLITKAGRAFLKRIAPRISEIHDFMGQKLSAEEIETLIELCEKIYRDSDT